jgi:hypothetical protein
MESLTKPPAAAPPVETSARRVTSSIHPPHALSLEPRWIRGLAGAFEARGIPPATLVLSAFVAGGLAAFLLPIGGLVESGVGTTALAVVAVCIPLRLICNLVADRMHGPPPAKRPEVFSGVPDLATDALIAIGAGYAASTMAIGPILGWSAALLGVLLAHVRTLTGPRRVVPVWAELTSPTYRMAALAAICVVAAIMPYGWRQIGLLLVLTAMTFGCAGSIWVRIASKY